MGYMKELDIRIRNGGDDAIAAACELAGVAKERRGYEDTLNAIGDITDIVTVLRGVGFSAVSPQAGDSASMLHYCVTHAANEIKHLRDERRWIPATERLPEMDERVMVGNAADGWVTVGSRQLTGEYYHWDGDDHEELHEPTHWMPLPAAPTGDK